MLVSKLENRCGSKYVVSCDINIVEDDVTVEVREEAQLAEHFESTLSLDEIRARRIEYYKK
jgi:hypothetical protein